MSIDLLIPRAINSSPYRRGDLLRPQWMKADERISLHPADQEEGNIRQPAELQRQRQFLPRVAVLFGRRGQGKTLWLTTTLWMMKERHRLAGTNFKVFTNYWTSFSDYASPYLLDELQTFPPWASNAIIGIDEIVDLLPSARGMSGYNLLSTTFFRQIRKRGCEVIGATQFPQELSRGILRQVDWFIETELKANGKGVKTYWHDWWGQFTGVYKLRYWPPERSAHDYSYTTWGTDQMFGHYKTEEVVASVYSDDRDDIINRQWGGGPPPLDGTAGALTEGDVYRPPPTFAELLGYLKDDGVVVRLDDLLDPAQEDYGDSLTDTKLRQILIARGYKVTKDHRDEWIVST